MGLLNTEVSSSNLHGIRVYYGTPNTSHLLFTDDGILFLRASPWNAPIMLAVLNRNERPSR